MKHFLINGHREAVIVEDLAYFSRVERVGYPLATGHITTLIERISTCVCVCVCNYCPGYKQTLTVLLVIIHLI